MDRLCLEIAQDTGDRAAAAALRRAVFVTEMGAAPGAEQDRFDADADHLILRDAAHPERGVVGTLRLAMGAAYTAQEFDLTRLRGTAPSLAEIGRACLHPAYRGGMAGVTLLSGAVAHLRARDVRVVVGTGSFPGARPDRHLPALRALRDAALAPADLRPVAKGTQAIAVEGAGDPSDMVAVPPLLKTYLRAGAWVGQGAWVDRDFDTVDVCLVLDLARAHLPAAATRLVTMR